MEKTEVVADGVDSIIFTSQGIAASTSALNLAVKNHIPMIFAYHEELCETRFRPYQKDH